MVGFEHDLSLQNVWLERRSINDASMSSLLCEGHARMAEEQSRKVQGAKGTMGQADEAGTPGVLSTAEKKILSSCYWQTTTTQARHMVKEWRCHASAITTDSNRVEEPVRLLWNIGQDI
jgi:hypothetical protein